MDEDIPDLFLPTCELRNGFLYRDLKEHSFDAAAKKSAGKCFEKCTNDGLSFREVSSRYNLPRTTIQRWVRKANDGETFHDYSGRPLSLDDQAVKEIQDYCEECHKNKSAEKLFEHHISALVNDKTTETRLRRGMHPLSDPLQDRTVEGLKKHTGLSNRKPQSITLARKKLASIQG